MNVAGWPVMASKCKTCPFIEGGWKDLREMVTERVITKASQTCHESGGGIGKRDSHLCRGARDFQLQIFHRLGFLDEPTDAAWKAKHEEVREGVSNWKAVEWTMFGWWACLDGKPIYGPYDRHRVKALVKALSR